MCLAKAWQGGVFLFFQYSALLQLLLIMEYSLTVAMLGLILFFH